MATPRTVRALVANRHRAITLIDCENDVLLSFRAVMRLTLVLRWPQGMHACETRCRTLMSRGMGSRNSMLARLREYRVQVEVHCGSQEIAVEIHALSAMAGCCLKNNHKKLSTPVACRVMMLADMFCELSSSYPVHNRCPTLVRHAI